MSTNFIDIGDNARRQYIDAQSTFTAREEAIKEANQYRGGMFWKRQAGAEYLIRTGIKNAQKSLGLRSEATEAIYEKFTRQKEVAEARLKNLDQSLLNHQRMNRALYVGRSPQILIDILNVLANHKLDEFFTIIGTHAMYAYEAAAGVRIDNTDSLATLDVDMLWDTRKNISFITHMKILNSSMIGILQKVDSSFKVRDNQKYTAVNNKGFEVDIIRREAKDKDPHPLQTTKNENDFWVVQAINAGKLLDGKKFSSIIASPSGHMARINTIDPLMFIDFKRWMASQNDRDKLKAPRDLLQADIIEKLINEYLPHLIKV